MKEFIIKNWFKILVIIFLILIYIRLGKIEEYNFNNWDSMDYGMTNLRNLISNVLDTTDSGLRDVRSAIEDINYR